MRKRNLIVLGCVIVGSAIVACAEAPRLTAPESSARSGASGPAGDLLGTATALLIPPVERNTPLASDVTWSFTVGILGATSSNSTVGLTIKIPAGALSSTQKITVTALAGSPVAYKFEPHGLLFDRDVTLTQKLNGTNAENSLLLSGAYFATDELELTDDGLAVVTEIISALVNPFNKTVSFPITHFSGYLVASGRSSVEE